MIALRINFRPSALFSLHTQEPGAPPALFKTGYRHIENVSGRPGSTFRAYDCFQQNPYLTAKQLAAETVISAPTVNAILAELGELGIIREITGRKWGRVFSYPRYLAILNEGTLPLPAAD